MPLCRPLDIHAAYRLATTRFLAKGKDGYEMLKGATVLVEEELLPPLNVMASFLTVACKR